MGEFQSLLLVLCLLYLAECLLWLRRGNVAFTNPWFPFGGRWRVRQPGTTLGNSHGAASLTNPLPPLGAAIFGQQWPLSVSAEAAFAFNGACLNPTWRPRQSERLVLIEDIKSVLRNGRNVLINDVTFLKASSPSNARRIVKLLRELKDSPAGQRAAIIQRQLTASFGADAAGERFCEFKRLSRPVRVGGNSLFIFLYVIAPAIVWRFGLSQSIWALVAGILAHTIPIAFLFRRAHRELYPDGAEERFAPFLTMLLAPTSAIRATDVLSKPLMEEFHALTVARLLLQPAGFREFARHVLLDLQHPILPVCPVAAEMPARTEQWFRETAKEIAEKFAVSAGLDLKTILEPEIQAEAAMAAYCARCGAQFVMKDASCGDCGGRPVQQWT